MRNGHAEAARFCWELSTDLTKPGFSGLDRMNRIYRIGTGGGDCVLTRHALSPLYGRNAVPRPANLDDFENLPVTVVVTGRSRP